MLILISPAKTLDLDSELPTSEFSKPDYLKQAKGLIDVLRELNPEQLSKLMGISDKLADLNYERNMNWSTPFTPKNARPALLTFKGDVYAGLEAYNFSERDFSFAQQHLRILSGLYGVLRPLDLMQPYRLEMGTKLANPKGDNLYDFWGEQISRALTKQLDALGSRTVINLASNEYFKAVKTDKLDADIITPVFRDLKNGKYKVISFFAKKARGRMSAWLIQNRIQKAEQLKDYDLDGYRYNAEQSKGNDWVFTRDEAQ